MQLKVILAALLILSLSALAAASPPVDELTVYLNTYLDANDTIILSPNVRGVRKIGERFALGGSMGVDAVSSATESADYVDAITGATSGGGRFEPRGSGTLYGTYYDDLNEFTLGGYISQERDYAGRTGFMSYTRYLNQENTELGISLSQSGDAWSVERDLLDDTRAETQISVSVMQLLSDTLKAQLTYSAIYGDGFLSSPYRAIEVGRYVLYEDLPDERGADALGISVVKLLNDKTSLNASYRYYGDDWDISSHTVGAEVMRDLSDRLTMGVRYRFYVQGEASFWEEDADDYDLRSRYVAVDPRYGGLSSHTMGVSFIYRPEWRQGGWLDWDNVKIKGSADYYMASGTDRFEYLYGEDTYHALYTTLALSYFY